MGGFPHRLRGLYEYVAAYPVVKGLPHEAGLAARPWVFFGGVMLMGAFSIVGLALYGLFINPEGARRNEAEAA